MGGAMFIIYIVGMSEERGFYRMKNIELVIVGLLFMEIMLNITIPNISVEYTSLHDAAWEV